MPCVGPVTIEVVLSELGDVRRFRSQKQVAAYAGLAPGIRESASRTKQLGITKEGSGLLRWVMIQTAWRLVGKTRRWGLAYERLKARTGAKKAIVAIARRLLGVMVAMLTSGRRYCLASEAGPDTVENQIIKERLNSLEEPRRCSAAVTIQADWA